MGSTHHWITDNSPVSLSCVVGRNDVQWQYKNKLTDNYSVLAENADANISDYYVAFRFLNNTHREYRLILYTLDEVSFSLYFACVERDISSCALIDKAGLYQYFYFYLCIYLFIYVSFYLLLRTNTSHIFTYIM